MQSALSLLLLLLGLGTACADFGAASAGRAGAKPGAVEIEWSVCPMTRTPGGLDVDDGGVEVVLIARGARPERLVVGRFPAECTSSESGAGFRLSCRDVHIDLGWVAAAVRGGDGSLSVEEIKYPLDERGAIAGDPVSRRALGTVTLPAGVRLVFRSEIACVR
jgi:hypothetical protein